MSDQEEFLRFASPNELRVIAREDAGYYYAVVIGAVYELEDGVDVKSPRSYFHPLKRCIEEHPFFSAIVGDEHTDKPFYNRAPQINLEDHIVVVEDEAATKEPLEAIGRLVAEEMDVPCSTSNRPPWRILVLPLKASEVFVAFSYSHALGDGPTGVAFHKTFLAGCREAADVEDPPSIITPPSVPLPAPFDTPNRIPISWSFLLAPIISLFLPKFIVEALGLRIGASDINEGTYTGSPAFFMPEAGRNKQIIREIEAPYIQKAIQLSRQHDAKLTGTMQELLTRAMSEALPEKKYTNFVGQTALDMRGSVGVSKDVNGVFASVTYVMYPRASQNDITRKGLSEREWESASTATKQFATRASVLEDHAVGLLRYLPSVRGWTLGKLGKARDSSFAVSNLGAFDPDASIPRADSEKESEGAKERAKVTKMVFSQPGHPTTSPFNFNFISVKGYSMVYTVTWQPGSLEVGGNEDEVVEKMCLRFEKGLRDLQ